MQRHARHLVAEVLSGRTQYGLMPQFPAPEALQLHVDTATAIQSGNTEAAARAMMAIMDRTMDEMSSIWERTETEPHSMRTANPMDSR